MNIAGFKVSKKAIIIVIGIFALFIIISIASSKAKQKKAEEEAEKERQEMEQSINSALSNIDTDEFKFEYDFDAEMQKELVKQYGEPPEGFKWSVSGELISLSDDVSLPEDVLYYFLRSLSVLDMSTAARYSSNSQVIEDYTNYYSDITAQLTDYYNNFLRKQYKLSLLSLEVIKTGSTSTLANGDMYIAVNIRSLDLTDKDFWQQDKEELFKNMRVYQETETDNVKMKDYLYSYILSKYEDGTVGKKETTIEIVLSKNDNKKSNGWLVSNDGELKSILSYENGVDVARYIEDEYNKWVMDVQMQEMQEELNNQFNTTEATSTDAQ